MNDITLRIYYEDTDAQGVVYHARYLNFLERARTEYLRQHGYEQNLFLKQNLGFVVKKIEIEYIKAAKLDDEIIVYTEVSNISFCRVTFKQTIVDVKTRQSLIDATVLIVSVDLEKMIPIRVPEKFMIVLQNRKNKKLESVNGE